MPLKKYVQSLGLIASLSSFLFLSSCSSKQKLTAAEKNRQPTKSELEVARYIQKKINSYRSSKGLTSLQMHPTLNRLAMNHSIYLAKNGGEFGLYGKNISHAGFKGRSSLAYKYNKLTIGENVGYARGKNRNSKFGNADYVIKLWLESSGHKSQLYKPEWKNTGLGVVVKYDYVVITQIFGRPGFRPPVQVGDPRNF